MNETAIWEKALSLLRDEMSEPSFDTWIAPLNVLRQRGDMLYIDTTSEFIKKHILMRYSMLITSAISQAAGKSLRAEFVTPQEAETLFPRQESAVTAGFSLNPKYTFDTFVVGNSNRFARAAALAVAEAPAEAYNPLFIYGGVGLGKTHLMHAIGHRIREDYPDKKLLYISSENFTNELITAIQQNKNAEFRNRFRNVDVLMVDDIQFIAGHNSTQEEFFHTFNTLYEAGKQIVVTSDRPPMEMNKLEDRIRTRLEWGLMADVQPPDLETRMAITRNKAAQFGVVLPDDVVTFIGETVTSNIRQLEGVVKKLTAYRDLLEDDITVSSVRRAIKDVIRVGTYVPTPNVIIAETARYFSVSEEALRGQSRQKNTATARQVAMYLCRNLTNMALTDIGAQFEGRNHATVLASIRKIEDMMQASQEFAMVIRDVTYNINSKA